MNMRHNPEIIAELRRRLLGLQQNNVVVALKTGTEVEDMDFAEIALMREVSRDNGRNFMPLVVKIGGPEARRDIRDCLST